MNEITSRKQFDEIPSTDIVLIVRKPRSKSRIHYARCKHLHTVMMNMLNPESVNSDYYHCKNGQEEEISELCDRAKWCRSCKNLGNRADSDGGAQHMYEKNAGQLREDCLRSPPMKIPFHCDHLFSIPGTESFVFYPYSQSEVDDALANRDLMSKHGYEVIQCKAEDSEYGRAYGNFCNKVLVRKQGDDFSMIDRGCWLVFAHLVTSHDDG